MFKKSVKIKWNKLMEHKQEGLFLGKTNDEKYIFYNKNCNALMITPNIGNCSTLELYDKYIAEFLSVATSVINKPSLIFLNSLANPKDIENGLENKYIKVVDVEDVELLNEKPSYCFLGDDDYEELFRLLFEARSRNIPSNNIYVFVSNIDENIIKNLDLYLTLSKSRKIYFIFDLENQNNLPKQITPFVDLVFNAFDLKILKS